LTTNGSGTIIFLALCLGVIIGAADLVVSPSGFLSPLAAPSFGPEAQGIMGRVTGFLVSPLCPSALTPLVLAYLQVQVLLQPSSGLTLVIPVTYSDKTCGLSGTFHAGLDPGAYWVSLTSCTYQPSGPGCGSLPKMVMVRPGEWAQVEISANTGIE